MKNAFDGSPTDWTKLKKESMILKIHNSNFPSENAKRNNGTEYVGTIGQL